jgi:hypothetical protein
MDRFKEAALRQGKAVPQPEVAAFHCLFLDSIKAGKGRISEATLVRRFTLFKLRRKFDAEELKENLKLGWKLLKRGRLRLVGHRAPRGQAEIKKILKLIKS